MMKRFSFAAALCGIVMIAKAGLAATAPLPSVWMVEDYLNKITTMTARFEQTANDGSTFAGNFMLKRPGKLRFEYDAPVTDFIVADGLMVHYYDGQMKQDNAAPISRSLADFFLRPNITLSGDISVSGIERADGFLQVRLVQSKDPLAGDLTVMLTENPLTLRGWRVVDAQGVVTSVALSDSKFGVPLKDKLFHYYDPVKKEALINK